MRWILIFVLTLVVGVVSFAHPPSPPPAPQQAAFLLPMAADPCQPPAQFQARYAPVRMVRVEYQPAAPVYFAAPAPRFYAAPAAYAAPAVLLAEPPKKQYATPIRDFLFGR